MTSQNWGERPPRDFCKSLRILRLRIGQRWPGDGMPKWEVIFARTLTPAEHGVRRSAGQGGPGPKKAPKPGFNPDYS
jgi:hypothetical protein